MRSSWSRTVGAAGLLAASFLVAAPGCRVDRYSCSSDADCVDRYGTRDGRPLAYCDPGFGFCIAVAEEEAPDAAGGADSGSSTAPLAGHWVAGTTSPYHLTVNWSVPAAGGRVLLLGTSDGDGGALEFDPIAQSWRFFASPLLPGPFLRPASAITGAGTTVISGGATAPSWAASASSRVLLFRSDGGEVALGASMHEARTFHAATQLLSGDVLVSGGLGEQARALASTELFEAASGQWLRAAEMLTGRSGHTATQLLDGRVLVVGGNTTPEDGGIYGYPIRSVEVFNPRLGVWQARNPMHLAREFHSAVLLPDGRVLIVGGRELSTSRPTATARCELYDPKLDAWSEVGALGAPRMWSAAIVLSDQRVMVAGGYSEFGLTRIPERSVELLDPIGLRWTPIEPNVSPASPFLGGMSSDGRIVEIDPVTLTAYFLQ